MNPLILKKTVDLPLPSDDDRRAYDQRLRDAVGLHPLTIPLSLLRKLPAVVRAHAEVPCIIGQLEDGFRLIDIGIDRSYSIALDLGTTNLVAVLFDNISQKEVLTRSLENPQVEYGSDIMTRMHRAMSPSAPQVYRALLDGINRLIALLCDVAGIDGNAVHAMTVAGNTVMSHFFLGLDISTIPVEPFVPVVRTPGFHPATELLLSMNPEALLYVFPNAGSYVGGDITAGILSSGMFQSDRTSILIDAGTNAEVVIGNHEWMIVGAGAAGPALEEGISRIGKRARKGIVYDVEIREGTITCKTFDHAKPEGICGSGMVSLIYEMYKEGLIDKSGLILDSHHVITREGERAFSIACDRSDGLSITQKEIQSFMKSKAAMFTLLLVLTRSVGISFNDIERVYVAGALGTGINAEKAVGIGMLPAWPASRVQPLGNSSLKGAVMLLCDGTLLGTVNTIVSKITYKPMNDDPRFMQEYRGAMFIPHTDPELLKVV